MNSSVVLRWIDSSMRFFFYLMIFWLAYSPAVIETSVIAGLVLWFLKRFILLSRNKPTRWQEGLAIFSLPKSYLNSAITVFIIACILSTLSTDLWQIAFQGFLTKTLEWFIIFFFALEVLKTKRHIQIAVVVFLVSAVAVIFDGFIQLFTHHDIFYGQALVDQRVNASFKDPNCFGAYLFFVFFILYARFWQAKPWKKKVAWGVLIAATMIMLALTYSRSAWLSVLLGTIFFLLFAKQKSWRQNVVIVLIVVLGLSVFVHREIRAEHGGNTIVNSADWRVSVWDDSLKAIKEKPLWGHGLNTFMRLFQDYRRKGGGHVDYLMTYAHNCYLQMAFEIGLMGLAAFLFVMGSLFRKTLREWRGFSAPPKLILALLSGLLAFLIQSCMDVNFYSLQLSALWWCMTGILVASVQIEKAEKAKA